MKFFLLALFAAVAVLSTEATLRDDFNDIAKLIPESKVKQIVAKHAMLDKQFQDFIKWVKTEDFSSTWDKLLASQEFRNIVISIKTNTAYDAAEGLNKLAALLKVAPFPETKSVIMPRTVNSFLRELVQALPKEDMKTVMKGKMITSTEFKTLMDHLSSTEFKTLVDTAMKAQSTAAVRDVLAKKGIELKKIVDGVSEVISWSY